MCLSFCICFPKQEAEHPSPRHPLVPSDVSYASTLKGSSPAGGERHPSVLSQGCLSRSHSSGWLVFVPNYKAQLYKVTQTVVYPEEIMCSLWPDSIVADSNGFWTFAYGGTESGLCCPMQFHVIRQCWKCFFSMPHLQHPTWKQESFSSSLPVHGIYLSIARNIMRRSVFYLFCSM